MTMIAELRPDAKVFPSSVKDSASSFFEAGIDAYRREDYSSARFYLNLADKLYGELGDAWSQKLTQGWYTSAGRHLARKR